MSALKTRLAHVFIHRGDSWYIPYTLRTCLKSDPATPVMLIGGKKCTGNIEFTNIDDYQNTEQVAEFNRAYLHLSTNPEDYEKLCLQRWFYLLEHMRRHALDAVFYHDTDVLFFSTATRVRELYGTSLDYAAVCILPLEDSTAIANMSAHSSYWTRPALEDFCYYQIRQYTDKDSRADLIERKRRHAAQGRLGGICDMTLISDFARQARIPVGNLLEIKNDSVFDHGIHLGDGDIKGAFLMRANAKIVRKIGRDYYFIRAADEKPILALSIHCQGVYKEWIRTYYRGGLYAGKVISDITRRPRALLKKILKRKQIRAASS